MNHLNLISSTGQAWPEEKRQRKTVMSKQQALIFLSYRKGVLLPMDLLKLGTKL